MPSARARRILATLTASALTLPLTALITAGPAAANTAGSIASIANGQTGSGPCALGGKGYVNPGNSGNYSCNGSGGKQENWCADFAAWAWAQAGVTTGISNLNGYAASFDTYGSNEHTISSTPHLGDAVVFKDSSGTIQHVGLVTGLPGGSQVTITSGNDYYVPPGTSSSAAADISANGQVQTTTYPASATGSSAEGWLIKEYVSPVTPPAIPAGFSVTLNGIAPGQTVSGNVNLTAMASSQEVINWLNYNISGPNGYSLTIPGGGGATNYAQTWNTAGLAAGSYTVSVSANEIDGQNHTYPAAPVSVNVAAGTVAAAPDPTGNIQVFSIVNGVEQYRTWFNNNTWGPEVGIPNAPANATAIAVVKEQSTGNLQIVSVVNGAEVYQTWFTANSFGGVVPVPNSPTNVTAIAATLGASNSQLFSVAGGNETYQTYFGGSSWGAVVGIPGAPTGATAIAAATESTTGNAQLFSVVNGGETYQTLFGNNTWGAAPGIAGAAVNATGIAAAVGPGGNIQLFSVAGGNETYQTYFGGGSFGATVGIPGNQMAIVSITAAPSPGGNDQVVSMVNGSELYQTLFGNNTWGARVGI
ncbi:hypothetical protein P3T36_006451 [Kitasatospora sp. MAP12-15]|uniref:CHAP domain-containing protein n=1 Tax=unclassified Kitasatospora TaxID=2633591 RepID=UPI00247709F7|nr:CHAP domain-containing protein [Kitasatospora sp. MAP12-44]MDH6107839.1 hypothetical protein [Kitasatospora sp. MAP12-44]